MTVALNTLYVTTPEAGLLKQGETVSVNVNREPRLRVPIHHLESIVCFGPTYVSPDLLGFCLERGVSVVFMSEHGRFRGRLEGTSQAGAVLRLNQVKAHLDPGASLRIAKTLVSAKLANQRHVLQRAARDNDGESAARLSAAARALRSIDPRQAADHDKVRGCEGEGAARYFEVFGDLVLQQRGDFVWRGRQRRPPRDPLNALLSFAYSLLMNDCLSALQGVGLDPAFGFLHAFRPGRPALALDLMEHLRPLVADRLVLTLLNNRQIQACDFSETESGAVEMKDEARKTVLRQHRERKAQVVQHPILDKKISWGVLPQVEARLLARTLRGDLTDFPPFHPLG